MPVFERPPLDTLAPAKDRWTPVYLEHGRVEVDDASVKWQGADGTLCRIPVGTLSALILGPGTTVTHAAIKASAQCNCPVFWLGEDGLRFYAFGITPNHDNSMARIHAAAWAAPQKRNEIARRMFRFRFADVPVSGISIKQLRGMEGRRVKQCYEDLGRKFGVTWKGRDYNPSKSADPIRRSQHPLEENFFEKPATQLRKTQDKLGMETYIPTEKKTKTAYSYIRFSSPQQMQGDSLRRQTEASEAYAAKHGLYLDHSLNLRDLGISAYRGKNATEGALAGFLQAIQTGRVPVGSILLVESLDRLSRDHISYALTQFLSIINAGVTVVTLMDQMIYSREKINENPGSLMMSIVIMSRAHDESASKSTRIGEAWAKKRKLAREKKVPKGKHCPNWLQLVTGEDGRKQYVVIPERAELLVRIFELAAGGLGKRSIAKILNNEKVQPWRGGKEWAESTLHFILKWPAARGEYQPCRLDPDTRRRILVGPPIEDYYPKVISDDLWHRAQCRTQAPRGPRRPSTHNLFTGLVIDPVSGCKMHYNEKTVGGEKRPYLCTARIRPEGVKSQSWPYDHFEKTILEHLRDLDWSSLVNNGPDLETARLNTHIAEAEIKSGKLASEINQFLDALTSLPVILRQSAMAKAEKMAEEKEKVEVRLEELRRQRDQLTTARNSMTAGVKEFKALIETGDPQSRLALQSEIRRRVKEISLQTGKTGKKKTAKITIYFVNGAATWILLPDSFAAESPSKAIEFERPGTGLPTLHRDQDTEEDEADYDLKVAEAAHRSQDI